MKYRDEHGRDGRYSGDVDEDHSPHGQGKMKYKDGSVFVGVWSEGSQVHGKTTKKAASSSGATSSSKSSSSKSGGKSSKTSSSNAEWARIKDDTTTNNNEGSGGKSTSTSNKTTTATTKVVRKMKWMDYYGDPGEYTGEVNSSDMPNGKGSMKYDHGLVQEGLWTKGQFVEGSDSHSVAVTVAASGGNGGGGEGKKKKSSRSGGGGSGGGSRKHSSSRGGRRMDP